MVLMSSLQVEFTLCLCEREAPHVCPALPCELLQFCLDGLVSQAQSGEGRPQLLRRPCNKQALVD